jgi:hypothetical protein
VPPPGGPGGSRATLPTYGPGATGHGTIMEEERTRPTTNQPLNTEPRRKGPAVAAVLGLLVVLALVFLTLTVLRYAT